MTLLHLGSNFEHFSDLAPACRNLFYCNWVISSLIFMRNKSLHFPKVKVVSEGSRFDLFDFYLTSSTGKVKDGEKITLLLLP